jgi:TorA maturation chaperone TorD
MTLTAETLQARQALYGVLQAVFRYPLQRAKLELLRRCESDVASLERSLAGLRVLIDGVQDWDCFLEDLNIDYTRLLEGPGRPAAPPYASFYLNDGRLCGPECLAVRRRYVEHGVLVAEGEGMLEDHVALELAFMSYLSAETVEAVTTGEEDRVEALLRAQSGFLRQHMLTWLPKFCAAIEANAGQRFFALVAALLRDLLADDSAWLAQIGREREGVAVGCP